MFGRNILSTVEERRQYITIVYDDFLWNALVVERASKQHDHAHTSHRSTSSVGLVGADGEFPVTRELELELIPAQMTQKPVLRAKVYARALCARQNRKEDCV